MWVGPQIASSTPTRPIRPVTRHFSNKESIQVGPGSGCLNGAVAVEPALWPSFWRSGCRTVAVIVELSLVVEPALWSTNCRCGHLSALSSSNWGCVCQTCAVVCCQQTGFFTTTTTTTTTTTNTTKMTLKTTTTTKMMTKMKILWNTHYGHSFFFKNA